MPSKSKSRPWPSPTIRSTLVNSERSSRRTEGCKPTAPSMDRSASERMRRASRIACETPYRCRRVRKTAAAKRSRFPVRKRRAFRYIVCEDGKELSGYSAANSFQIDSIWAFEASRYGRRSASRRASADSGSEAVIRSRFWRLEPARGRRAHDDTPVLELLDRGRPREEHRGLQFLDHRTELRHDRVRGDLRGLEHRLRHARHRGAKRDPFRRIEPAPNATGCDERQAHVS